MEVSELLERHAAGEDGAFDELVARLYVDLRRLAHRQLAGNSPGSLDTTGLVHEAYLRLVGGASRSLQSRSHFFAAAVLTMRSIVVDYARFLQRAKRGGGAPHETADGDLPAMDKEIDEILAVNEVLDRLAKKDTQAVRVVECRYFAGLSERETAESLDIPLRTVQRLWSRARALLRRELRP